MLNRGLYQTGLVFAILTALAWILFVVGLISSTQGQDAGLVEGYLASAESSASLMYLWGGILGSLFIIPVYLAMYLGFQREIGSVMLAPLAFAIVGVVFLTLGFMVDVGSGIYHFGPAVAQAEGQNAETMVLAAQLAQDSIEMTWAVGSFMAFGGPLVWIAILLFRSSRVPGWLNWIGIIGGLAGCAWILSWVPVPPVGPIPLMVNIVFSMVWFIGLSLVLVRSGEGDSVPII